VHGKLIEWAGRRENTGPRLAALFDFAILATPAERREAFHARDVKNVKLADDATAQAIGELRQGAMAASNAATEAYKG
jgi:hypothetical protein